MVLCGRGSLAAARIAHAHDRSPLCVGEKWRLDDAGTPQRKEMHTRFIMRDHDPSERRGRGLLQFESATTATRHAGMRGVGDSLSFKAAAAAFCARGAWARWVHGTTRLIWRSFNSYLMAMISGSGPPDCLTD